MKDSNAYLHGFARTRRRCGNDTADSRPCVRHREGGEDFPALEREELAEPGFFPLLGKIQPGQSRRHFAKFR